MSESPPVRDREQAITIVENVMLANRLRGQYELSRLIVDALLPQPDPEVAQEKFWERRYEEQHRTVHALEDEIARLREQIRELLADVELLEKDQDPPSVTQTARRLRHDWINDAFTQRRRAERAEAEAAHWNNDARQMSELYADQAKRLREVEREAGLTLDWLERAVQSAEGYERGAPGYGPLRSSVLKLVAGDLRAVLSEPGAEPKTSK